MAAILSLLEASLYKSSKLDVNSEDYSLFKLWVGNVVQVKKAEVRDAILKSAFRLFKTKGYITTTTAQIAAGARVSESNIYIYFNSKFEILFALCDPWMRERITHLEERLAGERDLRRRLQIILTVLWREMPIADNGFPNNLMQALATTARREGYRPDLLRWIEERIETLILECLPEPRRSQLARGGLAHMLIMAQDGFVLNHHLNPESVCADVTVDLVCDLVLGTSPGKEIEPHSLKSKARGTQSV